MRKRIALAEWRNQKEAEKAALALQASVEPPSARQAQHHRHHHQAQARVSRQDSSRHQAAFSFVEMFVLLFATSQSSFQAQFVTVESVYNACASTETFI